MVSPSDRAQVAPGKLEQLRGLVNTWRIPNDTRTPRDDLDEWLIESQFALDQRPSLQQFRDELRQLIERTEQLDSIVNQWIERHHIAPAISNNEMSFSSDSTLAGEFVTTVLEAITKGTIARLKACPDCRWVFYDNTRNASKKWCMMNATGPEARGCGNIAKARRHRTRKKKAEEEP